MLRDYVELNRLRLVVTICSSTGHILWSSLHVFSFLSICPLHLPLHLFFLSCFCISTVFLTLSPILPSPSLRILPSLSPPYHPLSPSPSLNFPCLLSSFPFTSSIFPFFLSSPSLLLFPLCLPLPLPSFRLLPSSLLPPPSLILFFFFSLPSFHPSF